MDSPCYFSLLSIKRRSHSPTSRGLSIPSSVGKIQRTIDGGPLIVPSCPRAILDALLRVPEAARNGLLFFLESRYPIELSLDLLRGGTRLVIGLLWFIAPARIYRCCCLWPGGSRWWALKDSPGGSLAELRVDHRKRFSLLLSVLATVWLKGPNPDYV